MLHIAVCDDQPLHGEAAAAAVADCLRHTEHTVRVFDDPTALLDALRQGSYAPRVAVLDVRMDGLDGITLAKQLNALCPTCAVLFLTAFPEYATDVYETEHVYFIVKSQLKQRMGPALEKALRTAPAAPRLLYYHAESSVQSVPAAEVLCLERCLRKTRLQTTCATLWTGSTPDALLSGEAGRDFIHCHRSYWVNFRHVRTMTTDAFTLYDGSRIPITRTYRTAARERFFAAIRETTGGKP